jgi:hypothetical protein
VFINRPPVTAALRTQDQRADARSFLVGQIAWVAQLAAVIFQPVLGRPHGRSSSLPAAVSQSQQVQKTLIVPDGRSGTAAWQNRSLGGFCHPFELTVSFLTSCNGPALQRIMLGVLLLSMVALDGSGSPTISPEEHCMLL